MEEKQEGRLNLFKILKEKKKELDKNNGSNNELEKKNTWNVVDNPLIWNPPMYDN